jgi:phage tail sheath protein FI
MNRGQLNVLGLTTTFTQGERDELYATPTNINPLQTFLGQGNVIWGQKTMQVKASALDRVNVRRLLIIIEKAISASLVSFTFENNNLVTRTRIAAMIRSYLDVLNAGGAFTTVAGKPGYKVVCDETNNTPAVIDQNVLAVDVYVKPAKTAEFIKLQTIITTSGASFEELAAQGV